MATDDGGNAFPALEKVQQFDDDRGTYVEVYQPMGGMRLRDYFAAKAMGDVFGHFNWTSDSIEKAAAFSYRIADAMIAERLK